MPLQYLGAPLINPTPANWDEATYLTKYPDVAKAVATGKFMNGADHYNQYGSQEGRIYLSYFPKDFSVPTYLQMYPDVAQAIALPGGSPGWIPSAQYHYQVHGIPEGRPYYPNSPIPSPTSSLPIGPVTTTPASSSTPTTNPFPSTSTNVPPSTGTLGGINPIYLVAAGLAAVFLLSRKKG